ncbi:MAG: preprotein translocase subunit YajC [Bacteroidales bacterium]|jgi:preprotein translocase subunit YajC|nr:preprotein translocase subunit YajC [Bacteroidales bacterium]
MNTLSILLQAQGGGGGSMLIWLILIFVVMWLLMVRPQQKQAKKEREFREGLKKGDRVSFSGGIYGKVHEVAEHTIDVEISNGVIVTVEKNMVQPIPEQPAAKK